MPAFPKKTSDLRVLTWTTVQHGLSGAGQFGDTAPLDDLLGPGPNLAFENGIWKYPEQESVGRFDYPQTESRPIRLIMLMAELGAEGATWEVHVAGTTNSTGTPYDAGDAALYTESDILVDSGSGQYVSKSYNIAGNGDTSAIIFPGQRLYLVTTGAVAGARIRFTLSPFFDSKA